MNCNLNSLQFWKPRGGILWIHPSNHLLQLPVGVAASPPSKCLFVVWEIYEPEAEQLPIGNYTYNIFSFYFCCPCWSTELFSAPFAATKLEAPPRLHFEIRDYIFYRDISVIWGNLRRYLCGWYNYLHYGTINVIIRVSLSI